MSRKISTIRLNKALPLLVVVSFGVLLLFSGFYQYHQLLEEIDHRSLEDVRRMAAAAQLRIETFARQNEQDLIAEEITGHGVDPNVTKMVLMDEAGTVLQATRLEWLGRSYHEVLNDFTEAEFQSIQAENSPLIEFSADRQRIRSLQPVVLALEAGQIRSAKTGALLLDYDLAPAKSVVWWLLVDSMYPIWVVSLLLMLFMEFVVSRWLERPLQHLEQVVNRFAQGEYGVETQLGGKGELAVLGDAWNRMSKELLQSVKQLEESKERFAVTLFSIGDAVIATDTKGCITFMNEIAQRLTAWTLADAYGKPLEDVFKIINAQTRLPAEAPVKRVLATGKIMGLANHTVLIARDNLEYQIADSAAPIRTRDGEIFGVVLVFRDVTEEYALREALFNERALLRALIDAVPDLIFYKDTQSVYLGCNKAFAEFAGRPEQAQIGRTDFHFFDPETAAFFRKMDLEMFAHGQSKRNEEWVTYPDGRQVLLDTVKTPFYSPEGKMLGLVGVSRDVTERRKFEEKLAENEERLRSLGNNLPNGYIYQYAMGADGVPSFPFISAGVEKIHGIDAAAIVQNPNLLLAQIDPAYAAIYRDAEQRSADELSDFAMELPIRLANGERRWIKVSSRPRKVNGLTLWDGVAIDITDKKLSDEQIWRQANFDPLTELPNRQMFLDRLNQEIKKAHRSGRAFALFFIDLDRFKEVNDTLGHDHGDQLLKIASERLLSCVRGTDTVARLGGDEFTIILSDLENSEIVERVAQNILTLMAKPFPLNDEQSYVSASVGITFYPTDSEDLVQLLKNADQAMYAAKAQGRNCYSYFTASMQEVARYRSTVAQDLRVALAQQQFQVHYQPIVDLKTGAINKAEALIRWYHPQKGIVSPAQFIPIAEEIGLIHDIGDWVFKEAARQAKVLRDLSHPNFQISINKSPVQFRSVGASFNDWTRYLEGLGLQGNSVVIEITEGLLLDASQATSDKLLAYRDAGIEVSLDDFGTGYSSLSYLKKFDIDYIKIDQSFVRNLEPDSGDMALCEAMIVMAHKLGIAVIAEGIETDQQRQLLMDANCDYGQGYLFSRPLPAKEFEQLLQNNDSC